MITAAVCMSHSPLMDRNRAPAEQEAGWSQAIRSASTFVEATEPDLAIVFFPDHLNGFLYDLMPSFCVGVAGTAIGDFGTVPGTLDIPEEIAADCAAHCVARGVDVAVSYSMKVDHGGVQPLEMLAAHKVLTRFVPIFVNCAAPPRPTFDRVRALGRAVGEWARKRPERIVIVGSGGLSHDPPLPTVATATGAAGKRLREGGALSYADRLARQTRVLAGGAEFSSGKSKLRPLNPDWDRKVMAEFAVGNLQVLDGRGDDAITEEAGCGSHELRCWIAALSAVAGEGSYRAEPLFYAPVNEWITGMGVLTASAA